MKSSDLKVQGTNSESEHNEQSSFLLFYDTMSLLSSSLSPSSQPPNPDPRPQNYDLMVGAPDASLCIPASGESEDRSANADQKHLASKFARTEQTAGCKANGSNRSDKLIAT